MNGRGIKLSKTFAFSAIVVLIASVISVNADIYRYIDDNGVMHFTNTPTSNQHDYKIFIKERTTVSTRFNTTLLFPSLWASTIPIHSTSSGKNSNG